MKKKTKLITGSIIASLTLASLGAIAITQINAKAEEERLYALYQDNIGELCSHWETIVESLKAKDIPSSVEALEKAIPIEETLEDVHSYFEVVKDSHMVSLGILEEWREQGVTDEIAYNLLVQGERLFYDDAYLYLCSPEALAAGIEVEKDEGMLSFFWEDWVYIDELNGEYNWDASVG